MANQEHLDLLKQGVESWNTWRTSQKNIVPDLSGADLSRLLQAGSKAALTMPECLLS